MDSCEVQVICPPTSTKAFMPFNIAVKVELVAVDGSPEVGTNTYQNDKLIGALGVNSIIVNDANETKKALQFTLDTSTGILSRWQGDGITPNNWVEGDVLVISTFFKLI
jgi:hypothetical protein